MSISTDSEAPNRAALPEERCPNISNAVAVPVEVAAAIERVPKEVMDALDRMSNPLDSSWMPTGTATAQADALCMKVIRDYIVCAAASRAAGPPQPKCIDEWACMMPGDCSRAGKCLADDAAEAAPGAA